MHFLPDVYVPCEVCGGKRYNRETLEIHYKGRSIAEVLDMTVEEALELLRARAADPTQARRRWTTSAWATSTSASRRRRSRAARRSASSWPPSCRGAPPARRVYLLDEPTTGLHFADVEKLLQVLHRLVDTGNTVIVIEHNLDVIKTADWIIDLGPEGGARGGQVVAAGTPEQVAATAGSATGEYLARVLRGEPLVPLERRLVRRGRRAIQPGSSACAPRHAAGGPAELPPWADDADRTMRASGRP